MAGAPETGPQPAQPAQPAEPDAAAGAVRRRRWFDSTVARKQATHGIYLEIVVLALILALESKRATDTSIVVTMLGAVLAVLLAELYAYYVGTMIGDGRRPTGDEFRAAVAGTVGGLVAVVPPLALLMLGVVGVVRLETGFTAAKWAGATVIGLSAYYATRRAGFSSGPSLLVATLFAFLGVGLVMLKHYFH